MKTPPQRSSELLHTRGRQLLRAFTDRRPSGNGLGYWSQGRLSPRIPKTQPTSLPVAWEISAIVRRKLPTTWLPGSLGCPLLRNGRYTSSWADAGWREPVSRHAVTRDL